MNEHSKKLQRHINHSNRTAAANLVGTLLEDGMPPQTVLTTVLDPAMVEIGKEWGRKQISLSQTFVAVKGH